MEKILSELVFALRGMNQDLLIGIVEKIGKIPDEEVVKLLQQFNIDYEPPIDEEDSNGKKKFIFINGDLFNSFFITLIQKREFYENNKMVYKLLINEDKSDKVIYANTLIKFESLAQRDKEFAIITKKLEQVGIILI
jgi:hypothetical protein